MQGCDLESSLPLCTLRKSFSDLTDWQYQKSAPAHPFERSHPKGGACDDCKQLRVACLPPVEPRKGGKKKGAGGGASGDGSGGKGEGGHEPELKQEPEIATTTPEFKECKGIPVVKAPTGTQQRATLSLPTYESHLLRCFCLTLGCRCTRGADKFEIGWQGEQICEALLRSKREFPIVFSRAPHSLLFVQ